MTVELLVEQVLGRKDEVGQLTHLTMLNKLLNEQNGYVIVQYVEHKA